MLTLPSKQARVTFSFKQHLQCIEVPHTANKNQQRMRDEVWPEVPATEDHCAMIVIFEPYGRLCNRLFLSAYGMALARASDQRFVNLSLGDYRYHFLRCGRRQDCRYGVSICTRGR